MSRPNLSSTHEIELFMSELPCWTVQDDAIVREIILPNFVAAIGAVNSIAILAEVADHHPDLLLYGWNKLRITLTTHDKGGLTKLDFELAKKIDQLNF